MINYNMIYVFLILASAAIIFFSVVLLRSYLNNKTDFRAVSILQFFLFGGFLIMEASHYLITGDANQMCILLTRNFLIFAVSAHLNCKLIGYKNIYSKKSIRNSLSIISNTLIYFCITCICMSYVKVQVYITEPNSLGRLAQISRFMETENYYPKWMSLVPAIYCLFSIICIIYMDFKERRNIITKLSGLSEIIPLIILLYDVSPITLESHYTFRIALSTIYFVIPTICIFNEAVNVIYFSKEKNDDIKELVVKSFRENCKKITNAGRMQAKIIAKEIEKNNDILWILPKGKKNENYKKYILNLLEDPE